MHVSYAYDVLDRWVNRPSNAVLRQAVAVAPAAALLALTIGVHWPSLHSYFVGDDFAALADIRTRSFTTYVWDVLRLRDSTPHWRPLTMLAYWAEFKTFGLDALGWRSINLIVHLATLVVLYALLLATTRRLFVALAAATIFTISPAAVQTVTYVTAFPHLLSELLLVSSLYALARYVENEERSCWYAAAIALFVLGVLANEGSAALVVVMVGYYAAASVRRRGDVRGYALRMAPFATAAAALMAGLGGCGCTGADNGVLYGLGWHIPRHLWVYMSRLAYPVGAIPSSPSATEWIWGSAVIAFAIYFVVRGPALARVAAVGMVLGVLPYTPDKAFGGVATRYAYVSTPFFAILVALTADSLFRSARRLNEPVAIATAAMSLITVASLYAWQTVDQTQPLLALTEPWSNLTNEIESIHRPVPRGTSVYVIDDGGNWTRLGYGVHFTTYEEAMFGRGVDVEVLGSQEVARLISNVPASRVHYSIDRSVVLVYPPDCGITTCSAATSPSEAIPPEER